MGFWVVEDVAGRAGQAFRRSLRFHAQLAEWSQAGGRVIAVKPHTYMNRSGVAVSRLMRYYRVEPKDLIVVVDDLDLPVGTIRIRKRGSHGGHRGLGSIETLLGSRDYIRLRVGIGRGQGQQVVEYVLASLPQEERQRLQEVTGIAARAVECMLEDGVDVAMNRFNRNWLNAPPDGGGRTNKENKAGDGN